LKNRVFGIYYSSYWYNAGQSTSNNNYGKMKRKKKIVAKGRDMQEKNPINITRCAFVVMFGNYIIISSLTNTQHI